MDENNEKLRETFSKLLSGLLCTLYNPWLQKTPLKLISLFFYKSPILSHTIGVEAKKTAEAMGYHIKENLEGPFDKWQATSKKSETLWILGNLTIKVLCIHFLYFLVDQKSFEKEILTNAFRGTDYQVECTPKDLLNSLAIRLGREWIPNWRSDIKSNSCISVLLHFPFWHLDTVLQPKCGNGMLKHFQ